MQLITRHLIAAAHNNAWANHRLLSACGQLTHQDLVAPRVSFFPSIRATLNHIVTVDAYYLDAMQRSLSGDAPHPNSQSFFDPEEPYGQYGALAEAQRASDRRLIALCQKVAANETLLEHMVKVPRVVKVDHEPLHRLLAHVFEHQTHHRGQVHAMLSGTSVPPPQLDDFYCADDASRRVEDFRALGFSEAAIWQDG